MIILLVLLSNLTYGQTQNEFTLLIKDILVDHSGTVLKIDTLISKKVYLNQDNNILIYEDKDYKYYTFIRVERSGNRIKVAEKNYITDHNGSMLASGKLRRQVQFINVAMPGKFENTSGEYLLIDKNNFTSIRATFLRVIYYGPNQPN